MTESEFWQQDGQYKCIPREKGEDVFSQCGRYRYLLSRGDLSGKKKIACFICLNPARPEDDPEKDDTDKHPTVKRCKDFTESWEGYAGFIIVNLFAYRETHSKQLAKNLSSACPLNKDFIRWAIQKAKCSGGVIIAAWGAEGEKAPYAKHATEVRRIAKDSLHCLGFPRHPSRAPNGCKPLLLSGFYSDA